MATTMQQIGIDTNWKKVSAGVYWFFLSVKTDGTLWSWGNNWWGQLGHGDYDDRDSPEQIINPITTDSWVNISAGGSFGLASLDGDPPEEEGE